MTSCDSHSRQGPHRLEVVALAESFLGQDLSAFEKLHRLARKHMDNVARRNLELGVTLRELDSLTGEGCAEMQDLRDRTENRWVDIVQEGIDSAEIVDLDQLFVKLILGLGNYAVLWYRLGGTLRPDEIADCTVDLMLSSCVRHARPS
ncbi:hypothetical protein [Rhodococcus sp. NCIMB 12038]|jgi:hypothetical protein|uniref:hypothetical protein n=1 Tax=Rhodococcus sp. NCIMB 12038 TaxID=933800 RepID=UPI000B3C6CB7|nr:hypothetical protein [Rhodococcus sp. NCIMB 12038]OUS93965.1 hypothetical protein CA951_21410 [Rhodococcus sp. NCIMB 12038]